MRLFGGNDKKKRQIPPRQIALRQMPPARPPQRVVLKSDDDQPDSSQPWQQSMGFAQNTRSKFWNNISGQSWNIGKKKGEMVRRRRRPH